MDDDSAQSGLPEQPSVLRQINLVNQRLEHLLFNLATESGAQEKIYAIAGDLIAAVDRNRDIALACILLNQTAGHYAIRHGVDTAVVAILIARSLEEMPEEVLTITAAALTMNVGMLQRQEQLQARMDAISQQEQAFIHGHPQAGVDMLKQAGIKNPDWLSYVLLHHENEDGSGYPFGKAAHEIPLNVKIISLADRYCARVSLRNYRKSLLPKAALSDILLADNNNIDPMLTACFIRELGTYPTGTFVRLESGELGVVTGCSTNATAPLVHVLLGADGVPLPTPLRRATMRPRYAVRELISEEPAALRVDMQQLWGAEARP